MNRLVLTVLLVVAAGCANHKPRLRISMNSGIMEPFPLYLCEGLGFLREEGIEARIEALPGSKGLEALLGDSVDIRYASASEILQAAASGRRLRGFFATHRALSAMLVVSAPNAGRMQRVEDLKGSTIGVATFGSAQHLLALSILKKHGLAAVDVNVIQYGAGPAAIAALQYGKADAGMINGSAFSVLRSRSPGVRVLTDPRTRAGTRELLGSDDYVNFSLMASPEWIGQNPDVARRLARAMRRTLGWIREHPLEQVLAKVPGHLRSADPAVDLESLRLIVAGLSEDGRFPPGAPEVLRRIHGVPMEKLREHGIELYQTYTNEFVPQ